MNLYLRITLDRGPCAHDQCGDCPFRIIFDHGDDNAPEYCTNPAWGPFDQLIINGKRTAMCLEAEMPTDQ